MDPNVPSRPSDLENPAPYTRLPDQPDAAAAASPPQRRRTLAGILLAAISIASLIALVLNEYPIPSSKLSESAPARTVSPEASRGVFQGVSDKAFRGSSGGGLVYPWSNAMLTWQRTAFHFQPEKNWMSDPNGPLFYKGWYHFFYQYNPQSAAWEWGKIVWAHAVSRDLINWNHLPFAMVPDSWFDINGVFSGSATILPDGNIVMLYTGDMGDLIQVQNLAYPANLSDPLLVDWVKYPGNPVLLRPPSIDKKDFRDPTTAWKSGEDTWRIGIGSKDANKTGITLVYETKNFINFTLLDGVMHAVPHTGEWECVDLFPVSTTDAIGLDTSFYGPNIKHVLKESSDDDRIDYYALGLYDPKTGLWTPENPELDVGIGLRYDYGRYYAAKSFYDPNKNRRVLWGFSPETDSLANDLLKGWASVQTIPRTIVLDLKTRTNILQWPVEEVEKLRSNMHNFEGVELSPGSIVPLHIKEATKLDISAEFEVDKEALERANKEDVKYNCTKSGAAVRGALGPFGILVIADDKLSEFTPIYFYISKGVNGSFKTSFCSDQLRSSNASDVNKKGYGNTVPVLEGEKLSMRILVDHSIVESFAQGGRTVITTRVYPTYVIDGSARVFLFNNATGANVKASVKLWEMDSANLEEFPLNDM